MKLYPFAPDPQGVKRHFEKMIRGELPPASSDQIGYGLLGSRMRLGSYTRVSNGGGGVKGAVIKVMSPTEVGLQQAKSALSAQKARERIRRVGVKKYRKKKTVKKTVKKKKKTVKKKKKVQSGRGGGRGIKAKTKRGMVHSGGSRRTGRMKKNNKKKTKSKKKKTTTHGTGFRTTDNFT
jgi:hypothetical protein